MSDTGHGLFMVLQVILDALQGCVVHIVSNGGRELFG